MIWRQDRDWVYALFDSMAYNEFDSSTGIPPGYYRSELIKGAFGWFYNTDSETATALGEPTDIEQFASEFTIQDFERGTIFYFLENNANNYVLFADDNTWVNVQE
jgi:hypothetical protein